MTEEEFTFTTNISPNNKYYAKYWKYGYKPDENKEEIEDKVVQIGKIVDNNYIDLYQFEPDELSGFVWSVDENDETYFISLDEGALMAVRQAKDNKIVNYPAESVRYINDDIFEDHLGKKYFWIQKYFHGISFCRIKDIHKGKETPIQLSKDNKYGFKFNDETKKLDYYDLDSNHIATYELQEYKNDRESINKKLEHDRFTKRWNNPNSYFRNLIENTEKDYDNIKNDILNLKEIDVMLFIGNYQYSSTNCRYHVWKISEMDNNEDAKTTFCKEFLGYGEMEDYNNPCGSKKRIQNVVLRFLINKTYEFCAKINYTYDKTLDNNYKYDPNDSTLDTYVRKVKPGEVQKKLGNDPTVKGFYDTVFPGEDIPEEEKTFPTFSIYWKNFVE